MLKLIKSRLPISCRILIGLLRQTPQTVQIEITNRCNLDCKMCPRKYLNRPNEDMPLETFKKIVDKLQGVNTLTLVGWGEPFIHPEIGTLIEYCIQKGHETSLTTNGLLLNQNETRKIALKLDSIAFSLDQLSKRGPGHKNQQVIENIKAVISERTGKKPNIIIQTVMLKNGKDFLEIIKLASKLGADMVNVINASTRFDKSLGMEYSKKKEICKQAKDLSKELGIKITMQEYDFLNSPERILLKIMKRIMGPYVTCPAIHSYLYAAIDGKITPCCELPDYIIGDLTKESLREIWHDKKLKKFRQALNETCKHCTYRLDI